MKKKGVFARLFAYMGRLKILMMVSIVFAAIAAVLNLSAFVCVYRGAKEIVQSFGDFKALNQSVLVEQGWQAVMRISMSFGTYGMALLATFLL